MLTQDMLLHGNILMLLGVKIHTFTPFGGASNIVTLANKMVNHTTHNLKKNRI